MSSFFVKLPLELREMIYEQLLISAHTINIEPVKPQGKSTSKHGVYPAILRTCKQAYAEGHNTLYKENRLHFECWNCDFFNIRNTMKHIEFFPVLGRGCDFQNIKHLAISYRGYHCDRVGSRHPETYLYDLKKGTESLTRLNCRLDTLNVTFDLHDEARNFEQHAWRNHEIDMALGTAVDKRFKAAVARCKVKDEIRITITSADTAGYRFTEAFFKMIGSIKGWVVTVDKQHFNPEPERDGPSLGYGPRPARKSVWTIFLNPAAADTKGQSRSSS